MVTFIGHINKRVAPETFPDEISDYVIVDVKNKVELLEKINQYALLYVRIQGMIVRRDMHGTVDPEKVDVNRQYVPMNMLTHVTSHVLHIMGQLPDETSGKVVIN